MNKWECTSCDQDDNTSCVLLAKSDDPLDNHENPARCPYGLRDFKWKKQMSPTDITREALRIFRKSLVGSVANTKAMREAYWHDMKRKLTGDKPMSARDKAATVIKHWMEKIDPGYSPEIYRDMANGSIHAIIEAVKEDLATPGKEFDHLWEDGPVWLKCKACAPGDHGKIILVDKLGQGAKCIKCGEEVLYPANPEAKPELIQGYTAEQWQEIIDGGYLCEFSLVPFDTPGHVRIGVLQYLVGDGFRQKEHSAVDCWKYCRPARIKGVMRPIFVEPVDKKAMCIFFDKNDNWIDKMVWHVFKGVITSYIMTPVKYIEL